MKLTYLYPALIYLVFSLLGHAEEQVVTFKALNTQKTKGELGLPLHTLCLVEAQTVDMSFTRVKADQGRVALLIKSVDSVVMKRGCYIDLPNSLGEKYKKSGVAVSFWGYETVGETGFPTEAFSKLDIPIFAYQDLHFRSKLVIIRKL